MASPSRDTLADTPDTKNDADAGGEKELDLEKAPTASTKQPPTRQKIPESDLARGLVGWDSQDDPAHPLNFPEHRKWTLLGLVSAVTFISPLASSMFSPALTSLAQDWAITDQTILSLTVTIYLLGYVVSQP